MKKYLTVFKISLHQEFAYRLNFIMWRVRNVIQILLVYFLWNSIFSDPNRIVFGYDKVKIITYVFGILVIRAIVSSSRSVDIAGEFSRGDLANYLIKPISYIKYWFTRDLSSKFLNIIFMVFEFLILFILLRPAFFFQNNIFLLFLFLFSLIFAVMLFFLLVFLFSLTALWYPEQAWGSSFLLFIFCDFMGGSVFPLDILPKTLQNIFYLFPFPYLFFAPLQIYLGKVSTPESIKMLLLAGLWVLILTYLVKKIWAKGLKAYSPAGK